MLTGCQTTPSNGRGEENRSTSRASNAIHVDNNSVPNVSAQPLPCNLSEDKVRSDTDANYPTDATTGPV